MRPNTENGMNPSFLASISWRRISIAAIVVVGWLLSRVDIITGQPPPRVLGGGAHGSVIAEAPRRSAAILGGGARSKTEALFLPDFEVYLAEVSTGTATRSVKTDVFGRYYFPRQRPGNYQLRWKAQNGWREGMQQRILKIANNTVYPNSAIVQPEEGKGVITGRVLLGDGASPWFADGKFKINHTATVSALNLTTGRPAGGSVRANALGDYALAGLPPRSTLRIRAVSEASVTTAAVTPTGISFSGRMPAQPISMRFRNRRPQVLSAYVVRDDKAIRNLNAGETGTLTVQAQDADRDRLTTHWDPAPGFVSLTGDKATIRGMAAPKESDVYVLVRDGKGGFARGKARVRFGQSKETFAGRVISAQTGNPVPNSVVRINGQTTRTDNQGSYFVQIDPAARFVMHIESNGFAPYSRLSKIGVTGQVWRLAPTQTSSNLDPTAPIRLQPVSWKRRATDLLPIQVTIPARALVREDGSTPQAPISASTVVLDISGDEAPGDWGALDARGSETNLTSFGAFFVEFRDGAGRKLNLARGARADVVMPVVPSILAKAPSTLPLWTYEEDGFWKPMGTATLDRAARVYRGRAEHFSTVNADLTFNSPACLKVVRDPSLPAGLTLRVTDPSGTNFTQSFNTPLDDVNAVYRLPPNVNVKVDVIDTNGNAIGNVVVEETQGSPLPGRIVNTGAPMPPARPPFPDPPYTDCHAVTVRLDIPADGSFLTFGGPSNAGIGTDPEAVAYYNRVDPSSLRRTLGSWWQQNGFTSTGTAQSGLTDLRTSYLNNNDLGSGRDMHFIKHSDSRVSAYVTNYGFFDQNPSNADLALSQTAPGATVCMEYSPIETDPSGDKVVKFFVYFDDNSGTGAGSGNFNTNTPIKTYADLDGNGPKFVPLLCLNCHGGSYVPTDTLNPTFAEVNMQASFRELDYSTYKFPGSRVIPNAAEKQMFHNQNLAVVASSPGIAITELITNWYTLLGFPDDQDQNFVPGSTTDSGSWRHSAFPQKAQLYKQAVAQSCRTCHLAFRGGEADDSGVGFNRYDQFERVNSTIDSYVCDANKFMPHAKVTFNNFWRSTSPSIPSLFRTFSGPPGWLPLSCP